MKIPLFKPILDMSSDIYHSVTGTWSSSQFKDMLDDEELFHKKYIERSIERKSQDYFDVGTYMHTGVLEPDKLLADCAIFPGPIRRGEVWEAFSLKHAGKAILTRKDQEKAEGLIETIRKSPVAMSYVNKGTPEVSMFVTIYIDPDGTIFCPKRKCSLGKDGWETCNSIEWGSGPEDVKLTLKVRGDSVGLGQGWILDLKSTSGNAKHEHTIKSKISSYNYDLSAALYLDVFTLGTGEPFEDFIWTFASKDYFNCGNWKADSENIMIGRAKWATAVRKLAKNIRCNWQFKDELYLLPPNFYERDWLKGDL